MDVMELFIQSMFFGVIVITPVLVAIYIINYIFDMIRIVNEWRKNK